MTHVLRKKIGVETAGAGIPQLPAVPGIGRYISLHGSDPADIYGRKHHGNLRRLRRGTDVQPRPQIISYSVVDMHGRNGIHLGFSCYKKIPSDFNSTPHSIRIRVYTGYNWRPWDATPEIAELEADGTLCFSLRDSNRERKTSRVILVSIGAAFTGIFALSAYDIFLSPTVQRKRQAKERAKRKAQKRDRSNCEPAPKS